MTDLSADERALIARYWPDLPEALLEESWPERLKLARQWLEQDAQTAKDVSAWRRGAGPKPVFATASTALVRLTDVHGSAADRTALPPVGLAGAMAGYPAGEPVYEPPVADQDDKRRRTRRSCVWAAAIAVTMCACGAGLSELLRYLTEGIQ